MYSRTLQKRILLLTLASTMTIMVVVVILTAVLYSSSARNVRVGALSFALGLVNSSMESDLEDIESLRRWVRQSDEVVAWLSESQNDYKKIQAHAALTDAFFLNGSATKMARVLIVSRDKKQLIQVGAGLSNSQPLMPYNLEDVVHYDDLKERYSAIRRDPLLPSTVSQVFTIIEPLYTIAEPGVVQGHLVIEMPISVLTDQLSPLDSRDLVLVVGNTVLRSDGGDFTPVSDLPLLQGKTEDLGHRTMLYQKGLKLCVLSSLATENISFGLVQDRMLPSEGRVLAALLICLLGFFALVWWVTHRYLAAMINKPVDLLLKRLKAIGSSQFAPDPSVEFDSEFGDIGRGMNELAHEVDLLIKAQVEDEGKRKDLEYRMLQYQISPHFLNNTLNSIKWMATIQNAPGIAQMVTSLSHLLKSISNSKESWCTIAEELSLLDDYLTIQSFRYGGTITFEKDVDDVFLSVKLPRFTFQPIVENAIFHGIAPKGTAGVVKLTAKEEGAGTDAVIFSISDNGVGMTEEQVTALLHDEKGHSGSMFTSIGLANVQKRIVYFCGEGYGLSVVSTEGVGTTVSVRLPMKKGEENHGI